MIHLLASQVEAAVREFCAKNGNVFLSQVRNGTGFERRNVRTADMLSISTWPSRGLFAEGYEVKVDRGDLRRELANPSKAEEIAKYCSYWWIAGPEGVADGIVLPENWGLLAITNKLKVKVEAHAKKLTAVPMDTLFVCAVLRSFAERYVSTDDVDKRIKDGIAERIKRQRSEREDKTTQLEAMIGKFKEVSGVDLLDPRGAPTWDVEAIGEAVAIIRSLRSRPIAELKELDRLFNDGRAVVSAALEKIQKEVVKGE